MEDERRRVALSRAVDNTAARVIIAGTVLSRHLENGPRHAVSDGALCERVHTLAKQLAYIRQEPEPPAPGNTLDDIVWYYDNVASWNPVDRSETPNWLRNAEAALGRGR